MGKIAIVKGVDSRMTGLDLLIYILLIVIVFLFIWYLIWIFAINDRGNDVGAACSNDNMCKQDLFCNRQGFCQPV